MTEDGKDAAGEEVVAVVLVTLGDAVTRIDQVLALQPR
jgi:hypothetical protein